MPFAPREQAKVTGDFLQHIPLYKGLVGSERARGARFALGPFAIESYVSAEEPVLTPWSGPRLIFWTAYDEQTRPWRQGRALFDLGHKSAVGKVTNDYLSSWSSSARRWVKKHRALGRKLEHVSFEEFAREYESSKYLDILLRKGFLRVVKEHIDVHPHDVHLLLARDQDSNELLGGVAFVDFTDISLSHYLISFLTPLGKKQAAAYAYIDWWYQHLLKKGICWADFGIVWQKGDPHSWKGYSEFKTRFNPEYKVKRVFWRITFSKKDI